MSEDVLLKQLPGEGTHPGNLSAGNVDCVISHLQAGELQGDAVRARPPAHSQRNIAASRADVEDA